MKCTHRCRLVLLLIVLGLVPWGCSKKSRTYDGSGENSGGGGNSGASGEANHSGGNDGGNNGDGGASDKTNARGGTGGTSKSTTMTATGGASVGGFSNTVSTAGSGGTSLGGSSNTVSTTGSGGTSLGGNSSIGGSSALICESAPTIALCGGQCVDLATSAKNCRQCGHDCGYGSSCTGGVCSPVTLRTNPAAITSLDVDNDNIVFSPTGVLACPATGCTLSPTTVTTNAAGSARPLANGFALSKTAASGVGANVSFQLCPLSGCTTDNTMVMVQSGNTLPVEGVTSSARNFYYTHSNPVSRTLSACISPIPTGCTSTKGLVHSCSASSVVCDLGGISTVALATDTLQTASDSAIYFQAAIDGGTVGLYSYALSSTNGVPVAMDLPSMSATVPRALAAFENDLYFLQETVTSAKTYTVQKCPQTGCTVTNRVTVAKLSGNISALEVDASGAYWIIGSSIQMCPIAGCVGGPVEIATAQGTPHLLRLNEKFVYWVNDDDNTIHRVAKP